MAATAVDASKSKEAVRVGWAVGVGSAGGGTEKAWTGINREIGGRPR